MAQPSKAGAVFLFLFGMPFLGFGLFAAYTFLSSSPSIHQSGNPIFGAMFALVFAVIGGGLMFGSIYGYGQLKQAEATKEANPDAPCFGAKTGQRTGQRASNGTRYTAGGSAQVY